MFLCPRLTRMTSTLLLVASYEQSVSCSFWSPKAVFPMACELAARAPPVPDVAWFIDICSQNPWLACWLTSELASPELKSPVLATEKALCPIFWLTSLLMETPWEELTSPKLNSCANAAGVTAPNKDIVAIRAVVFGDIIVLNFNKSLIYLGFAKVFRNGQLIKNFSIYVPRLGNIS